ncbi:hypothetical protein PC121_g20403 [Phytophthora cactorum]|nr:hypothetical protein PC120_g17770 [Phytophthora cactorum]KAG3046872.1 hypothetical protein PC121_g20403 [Phytophthora cactorum]
MRVTSPLHKILGTTLATTPRHKAFHVSGDHHARRAEPAEDEPRLDPRAASHHDGVVLDQRVRSLSSVVHDSNASLARLAGDLEEMHRRVDWFEAPSALQNRVVDLERQVAQL